MADRLGDSPLGGDRGDDRAVLPEVAAAAAERGHRRKDALTWGGLAVLGVGLALGAYAVRENSERADEQAEQIAALQAQAAAGRTAAEQLCEQVRAMNGVCVTNPEELPRGEQGERGVPGPAGRGVADQECVLGVWQVTYTDGYTDYDAGLCTGVPGKTGASGAPGEDGTDGVDGQPGAMGPAGADGRDGRGVADTQCDPGTGRWVVTYTDGTVADGGPCMWRPGPDPS